jgi:hypothetical protein
MGLFSALTREEYFCYREFLALLAKYKFVIAIENAVCEDYVTEKLWRALHLGAVPLYLGRLPNCLIFAKFGECTNLLERKNAVLGLLIGRVLFII